MAELSPFDQINQLSKQMSFTSPETEQDRRAMFAQMRSKAGLKERSSVLRDVIGRGAIGQGLAMGAGDELEAYARSLASGKPYEEELNKVRSDIAVASAERPGSMLLGELGGAIAQIPAAMLVSGGTAAPAAAARTAGLATRLLEGAKTGALVGGGLGGVEGFFKGEGGAGARLENAATSAALGGVIGGGLGAALPIGAGVIQQFKKTPEELAASRAMQVLAEDKMTPDQLMQAYLARQTAGVKPELPMEVAPKGGSIVAESRRLAQVPGSTRGQVGEFLEQRALGQQERLGSDIEAALGGQQKNIFTSLDDLAAIRMQQASPLYQKVDPMSAASAQMDDLLKKVPSNVFSELEAVAQIKGTSPAPIIGMTDKGAKTISRDYTYAEIDSIQKALDDQVSSLYRLGKENQAKVYKGLRDDIIGIAEKNPDYRQARSIWADSKAAERAMAEGQNIFKQRAEITERNLKKMTQADKDAYLVGVFDSFQNVMKGKGIDKDVTNAFSSGAARDRMRAAIQGVTNDPAAANQIVNRLFTNIERESVMAKAKQALGGSQTAPLGMQQEQFLESIGPMAGFAQDLATGAPLNAMGRFAKGIGDRYRYGTRETTREKTNEALSKMMFAKSAPELKQALDAIRDQLAKKGQYEDLSRPMQLAPGLIGGLLGSR
jgi:hypothetical protein